MKRPELGDPLARYALKELRWKDFLREFLPLVVIAISPTLYGIWRTLYGYSNFGPAAAASWGRSWFLIGSLLVLALLFYSLNRIRKAHTWIEVYPWGLLLSQPPWRKIRLPWETITGITSFSVSRTFFGIPRRTSQHLVLHSSSRRPIACHPRISNLDNLKKLIKKKVYQRIQPQIKDSFQAGEIIPFGEVSISKGNLFLPKQDIPWDYIEGIQVSKGIFMIDLTTENRIEIPIRRIQNLEVLVHLIKTEI